MQIIELCGIPGCGKSTLINAALRQDCLSHTNIATRQDIYFFRCKNKKKATALFRTFAKIKNYKIYVNILIINRRYSKDIKCLKYAVQFMMLLSQIQEVIKSNIYEIAILDEGIYQYISAQADNTVFKADKQIHCVIDEVRNSLKNWSVFYCDIEVDDALERISKREGSSKRFSASKSHVELKDLLEKRKNNIDYLCSIKSDLSLDMNNNIDENAIQFLNYINMKSGG